MTEKEKGKFNPFVKTLRDTEEILWLHSGPITMSQHVEHKEEVGETIGCVISFIYIGLVLFLIGRKAPLDFALILLALSCIVLPLLMWLCLAALRRSYGAYAVTNERLLHYEPGKIRTLKLEDLTTCYETNGTLHFNILYPAWHNVPDAKAVLSLIKKSADTRANELQEKRFDERKREEQA